MRYQQSSSISLNLFVILIFSIQFSTGSIKSSKLLHDLLNNYNVNVIPVKNSSEPIYVELNYKLQHFDLNFEKRICTTKIIMELEWYDYQLEWEPNKYDYIPGIIIKANSIWLPDLAVYNNAGGDYIIKPDTVRVQRSGKISAAIFTILKTYCELDTSGFPFDRQMLSTKIGSWTHDGNKMDLKIKDAHTQNFDAGEGENSPPPVEVAKNEGSPTTLINVDPQIYEKNDEWDLIKIEAEYHVKYYNCCAEPFVDIVYQISVQRKSGLYILPLILPWIIFTLLPIFSFFLPANSNLKITFLIFLFLILLTTLLTNSSSKMILLLMTKHYSFTIIILAFILFCAVCNLNFDGRTNTAATADGSAEIPKPLKAAAKQIAGYVLLDWSSDKSEWEQISKVVDRSLFGICTLICTIGIFILLI